MLPKQFQKALPILIEIERAHFEAYFVGGSVRDYLLGRPINDVDIATSALPQEIKSIFPNTVDIGIEHGTVLVNYNGEGYEITTFRTETEYKDFRRPEGVTFIRSLNKDLERRDFTMNAIAMNKEGSLIDPYHGKRDIANKIITTVGSPHKRFNEDALRMMRAIRFISQLGFDVSKETIHSLTENAHLLEHISVERITAEFEKLIEGDFKHAAFNLLNSSGMYQYLPGYSISKEALTKSAAYSISTLSNQQIWGLILFHINREAQHEFLKAWKLPSKKINYLIKVHNTLQNRVNIHWDYYELYKAGIQMACDVEILFLTLNGKDISQIDCEIQTLKNKFEQLPVKSLKEIDITGHDLIRWKSQKGGTWVKELLQEIEEAVVNQNVENNKNSIREWLISCNHL
ncbi:tRNA nucleotidyltransferase (CCA-adding enzyme) [Bacillus pakistanensis]|uniref:CCA-adding enzyme n=1 Tax=Rossellomorea pakistanensis TaxID=992288 RepID=A0ABS2N963_9BACI|nr:CCA tRNA nucleotidyltransferase [Bacillus pakistanensis]MBM7584325.1 tRNA nucleotidyltransferase (CCA-adding enzyme) [Bacillus pakistanensis]